MKLFKQLQLLNLIMKVGSLIIALFASAACHASHASSYEASLLPVGEGYSATSVNTAVFREAALPRTATRSISAIMMQTGM